MACSDSINCILNTCNLCHGMYQLYINKSIRGKGMKGGDRRGMKSKEYKREQWKLTSENMMSVYSVGAEQESMGQCDYFRPG